MTEREALQVFYKFGAITYGHFVYASGRHGSAYINKDAIYPYTRDGGTSLLCRAIAEQFANDNVEAVIAPAIGGVILSHLTARHLSEITGREVFGVYAEKTEKPGSALWHICFGLRLLWRRIPQLGRAPSENFVIKRGYNRIITGKNVLVVEDILTTGNSVKKVVEAARVAGGNVIGLGVLWNRGGINPQDMSDIPKFTTLINVKFEEWDKAECSLCKRNIPINEDLGKGRTLPKT